VFISISDDRSTSKDIYFNLSMSSRPQTSTSISITLVFPKIPVPIANLT
jgi:hypothetical protein